MSTDVELLDPPEAPSPARAGVRKPPRRKPIKKATIWLHRWTALVLGLLLLIVTTSGAVLVYQPELEREFRSDLYLDRIEPGQGQPFEESIATAEETIDGFVSSAAWDDSGTHVVQDYDTGMAVHINGETGEVLGSYDSYERAEGWLPWTLALMENIHLCGLTCADYPGYQSWLVKEVPYLDWAGFEDHGEVYPVTWGGLLLGITALLLVFLSLSGIWLWWPTVKRFSRGVRIRMGKGRYARDYDLHQVVGMIALPLLLLWGLTGMSYEFGFVEKGWYAATPGDKAESEFATEEPADPEAAEDITLDEAIVTAQQEFDTSEQPVFYELPVVDDPTGFYGIWFSDGFDPWVEGAIPGDVQVLVDRYDATNAEIVYGIPGEPVAQTLYQDFNYPVHSGYFVNGWLRIPWLILGLVPLLLAWTGVSTWLFKRTVRKRRKGGAKALAAAT